MDLAGLRKKIDELDAELLRVLAKRMDAARKIGEYKKSNKISLLQPEREKQILEHKKQLAQQLGLDKEFVERLYRAIIDESLRVEKET